MYVEKKSVPENKLHRIYWKNVWVAYCVKCQHTRSPKTERCAECGAKLVPKVEHVQVTKR